ncbi:MAG: Xaa-Pro peptidase family protein [Alphaproteobacteria bacterium]|nr:Xaa-Pro peptidase family protein [Alphaproteobacteria bacterium]
MTLHFSREEFAARRDAATAAMAEAGLDGLLMFRQESMYYLTGYDTFGYVFFQCLYLGADGRFMLLTRAPDLRQARFTSVVEDVRIWVDLPEANPAEQLRVILDEYGCRGRRLGVEYDAYGLTAANGKMLDAALDGFCTATDASRLVSRLRLVKSPAELAYAQRAAELADAALDEINRLAVPGAFEGDILAAMQAAIYRGDGDDPANEQIIGSGPGALMCRYYSGRRRLTDNDQLTVEFAGVYRHYHACLMRTVLTGTPDPEHRDMHKASADALQAAREALLPDRPIGEVFDAHARVLDAAGYREHRLNACGYALGTTFAPNWMDWPMFFHGNPVLATPGMVFFIHIIIMDSDSARAMTLGQTVQVTDSGSVPLSRASTDLVVN